MLGNFLSFCINLWVGVTGRKCRYDEYPWLRGPMGETDHIGPQFYEVYARLEGLEASEVHGGGLVPDFSGAVADNAPNRAVLSSTIVHFYEHTSDYRFEVWSEWYAPISWGAKILISLVSRKMDQLNIPLHPLETSRGMSNNVIHLRDPRTGKQAMACWLRRLRQSGRVVYAGFYSQIRIGDKPFVRVVFPLRNGSATVLLRVDVQPDGSVTLVSHGKGVGDAGYYRVCRDGKDAVRVKYVPLKETIHVFVDEEGILRTDHIFYFWRRKFLHLHYKILPLGK